MVTFTPYTRLSLNSSKSIILYMEKEHDSPIITKSGDKYVVLKTEPSGSIKPGDTILMVTSTSGETIGIKPSPVKEGDKVLIFGSHPERAIGIEDSPEIIDRVMRSEKKTEVILI